MQKDRVRALWENPTLHYAVFSFFVSLFGILMVFAAAEIPPFGERSLLSMDAWSQYFPMLMEGKDGLSQWSWSGALGFNRLAQSAYYTMSPLNLLLYLFPRSGMYVALHLIIALRFALAGLFCYLFLAYRHRPTPAAAVFALAYSLSAYPLAFLNQFMWLDAVVLLPLVALGLLRLVREGRSLLYILSLALTLYSCFYIGYMVCLFSVLYFAGRILCEPLTLRERAVRCGHFALSSLLAGGLAAAVLLPTYLALRETIASGLSFDGELRLYHGFFDIMRQFLPFGKFSLEYQAPNLYCGTLTLLLFIAAIFLPGKRLRERVLLAATAVLIYFSCTLNLLDYVWHGMHYPNQLPGRQSFLFIFLIVGEAYAAFLLLADSGRLKRWRAQLLSLCLLLFLSAELLVSAAVGVSKNTWTCTLSSYSYWDEPMAYVEKTYSDGPWRSEKLTSFHFNSGQLYRYHGISYYSSTMTEEAYRFFGKIGMGVYAQNVSTLYKPTNILNMLFGVRYLHAYNGDLPEEGLLVDPVETVGTVTVYENRYSLPLAFLASRDALTLNTDVYTATTLQHRMLGALLGDGEGRYYLTESAISDAHSRLSAGAMTIDEFSSDRLTGTVTAGEDALLFTSIPADRGWRVTVDGERVEPVTVFGYLLAVPLSAGEHTVELSYTAPGFGAGLAISLLSAAATVLLVLYERRRRRA